MSRIEFQPADSTRWVTRDVKRILIAQLVFGFGWSLYLLTPKYLATALHAGPEIIGRIGAMGGLAGLLTVPFAAYALDRLGRRLFFQLGSALIVLLSLGFGQVHAVGPLVYVLQGCISAAFVLAFNGLAALLTDYAPPEKLGQAIGWVGGCNVLMNAVATMIAEPLAAQYGWHVVFALGVVAGSAAFVLSFGLRESAARHRPAAVGGPAPSATPQAQLGMILLAATLMGGVFIAVFGFVQPYAVSVGAAQVRLFFLGFTLSAVTGRVLLGGIGDRLGRRNVSIWLLGGYAASALLMRELQPELLFVYGLVFGAAHGVLYPTLNALVLEVLPAGRRGLGMVLYNGAFNLGCSLGSLAWGLVAKGNGYPAVYWVATATALFAAAILLLGTWAGARPAHHPNSSG